MEAFSYLDNQIWQAIYRWAKRRHPNKSSKWVLKKYFKPCGNYTYSFHGTIKDRRGKDKTIFLQRAEKIHIKRHVLIKGASSPDDPSLAKYWEERQRNTGKKYWERGSLKHQVAENQKWKCPVCGESLFNGEDLQIHHITKVINGGTDELVEPHRALK